jgi:ribosome assembly protein 1
LYSSLFHSNPILVSYLINKQTHKQTNKQQLNVVLPPREINPRDPRATLQAILRRWLPLSEAVLRMIIRTVPDPVQAQRARLFTLLPGLLEGADTAAPPATGETLTEGVAAEEAGEGSEQKQAAAAAVGELSLVNSTSLAFELSSAPRTAELRAQIQHSIDHVTECVGSCSNDEKAPLVVYVSKLVPVRVADLAPADVALLNAQRQQQHLQQQQEEGSVPSVLNNLSHDDEVFVALARVFSGVLKRNSSLYVLGSKYDPMEELSHAPQGTTEGSEASAGSAVSSSLALSSSASASASALGTQGLFPLPKGTPLGMYIMLGPSVVPVEQVPAGNIVGIVGLHDYVLKTATLCSTWAACPMTSMTFQSKPMLKVAVEPTAHQDLRRLESGMRLLHQFDPVVEVGVDHDTGQNTMTCLGELHLEQCVKALTERFAK